MKIKSEDLMVSAIKAGNKKVFELFFNTEYSNLKFFVYNYVKDFYSAEDITQETFLTLWKGREMLDSNQNIRSYLFTIARNKSLNYLRYRATRTTDELDRIELQHSTDSLSGEYLISKIDSMDMEKTIEKTFTILPVKIRETFILSRKEEYTYEEISMKLGISTKVVERNISAALKIFRKHLKRYF